MTRRIRRHASLEIPLAFPRVVAKVVAPLRRSHGASWRRFWILLLSVFAFVVVRFLTL